MTADEKKCPRCAEMIKAQAYACRFCGLNLVAGFKPQEKISNTNDRGFKWLYFVGSLAGLFLIVRLVGCDSSTSDPSSLSITSADQYAGKYEIANQQGPIVVSIDELVAEYKANEAAAQERYGGQLLRVSGIVSAISLGPDDKPFVSFESAAVLPPAQAKFSPTGEAGASALIKGEAATFLCSEVSEVLGSPMLGGCVVQPTH